MSPWYFPIKGDATTFRHLSEQCVATLLETRVSALYPPAMDEQPLNAGILELATHKACGTRYHYCVRWALTPPFHPYLNVEAVIFCHTTLPLPIASR